MALAARLAHGRVYYGWYLVGVAFLVTLTMSGMRLIALSIFLKPMVAELEWTRAQFALFVSLGTLTSSFLTPLAGPILDRRGARGLIVGGGLLAGGGFMALGLVREPWHFILILNAAIAVGMTGMSGAVVNVAVANWFVRKRGRAVALGTMGLSAGAILYPPLVAALMGALGWRWAWVALGFLLWVLLVPAAALLVRRRPEDLGLRPDGQPEATMPQGPAATPPLEPTWTVRQVAATPALWLLVAAYGFYMLGLGSLMFHLTPYLTDVGFSLRVATTLMSVWGAADLAGRVPWGLLIERVSVKYCALAAFLGSALAVLLIALAGGRLLPVIGALIVFGVVISGTVPMEEVMFANYYGRRSLGRVRTIAMPFITLGSAIGSPLAGYIFDTTGSYRWAFVMSMVFFIVGSFFLLLARPPRRPR